MLTFNQFFFPPSVVSAGWPPALSASASPPRLSRAGCTLVLRLQSGDFQLGSSRSACFYFCFGSLALCWTLFLQLSTEAKFKFKMKQRNKSDSYRSVTERHRCHPRKKQLQREASKFLCNHFQVNVKLSRNNMGIFTLLCVNFHVII